MSDDKLVLSIAETCKALGITKPTLYKLINDGTLRTLKIGTRRVIRRAALDEMLRKLEDEENP